MKTLVILMLLCAPAHAFEATLEAEVIIAAPVKDCEDCYDWENEAFEQPAPDIEVIDIEGVVDVQ